MTIADFKDYIRLITMTELNKTLARRTRSPLYNRKRIVVQLEPGDLIAMRLERSRTYYRARLEDVFRQMAQWHAAAARKERKNRRK